jgi:3-oxoacyl-[acyl-carrier protein] reductase
VAVVVTHGGAGFGRDLTDALRRQGADVHPVDPPLDRAGVAAALQGASTLVHVCGPDPQPAELTEVGLERWGRVVDGLLLDALAALQGAHDGRARIVIVVATIGIPGAARLVPYVTAIEGVRSMAKSAARQWGGLGLTVNLVGVPIELLAPGAAGLTSHMPPPVTTPPGADDVAHAVLAFALAPGVGITGAMTVVDGGAVMAP